MSSKIPTKITYQEYETSDYPLRDHVLTGKYDIGLLSMDSIESVYACSSFLEIFKIITGKARFEFSANALDSYLQEEVCFIYNLHISK